jgi:hypothetical protein
LPRSTSTRLTAWCPRCPRARKATADHSKFKELQGPFKSGPEVTAACLGCHTEAAKQIKGTIHWKWEEVEQDSKRIVGKNKVMNNFCVSTPSNQQFCTGCHVGYGDAKSGEFVAFSKRPDTDVDCLVCHDQTGKYIKAPYQSGNPPTTRIEMPPGSGKFIEPIDLALIAQHVGEPSRANCGTCHFSGGGGDGVKHGDLDSSLTNPPKSLDVHMAKDGLNFQCQTCHATGGHEVSGSHYKLDAKHEGGQYVRGSQHNMGSAASCQSCHGDTPAQGQSGAGAEHAHPQYRLPDLPHPRVRPRRRAHQNGMGLFQGRPARPGRQAPGHQGRARPPHLPRHQRPVQTG